MASGATSSADAPLSARDTPWNIPVEPLAPEDQLAAIPGEPITAFLGLKSYSLRNGKPEDVVPYLLTTSIPEVYFWVPIHNLPPKQALSCIDGFIRCYLYRFALHPPREMDMAQIRRAAIILGVARAVMLDNYELSLSDINQEEITTPLLSVAFTTPASSTGSPVPAYKLLVHESDPLLSWLTEEPKLSKEEMNFAKVMLRCAQAVIPLQGLNIMNDGHHYLSDRQTSSFRAFFAVEKQLWVAADIKKEIKYDQEMVRDTLWHKSGHPVSVQLKQMIAADPNTKVLLKAAKLGSAAARLPAMDPDLRVANTYLKVADSVNAIWQPMGGSINADILRYRTDIVKELPRGPGKLPTAIDMHGGITVETREEAIMVLKDTLAKNADRIAMAFGFYDAFMEASSNQDSETLRAAYSLNRLKKNYRVSYLTGVDYHKDYRARLSNLKLTG